MRDKKIPNILSIAGSDPSGGAGVQADLKTFSALSCYGMAVMTALTAQNTTGVQGLHSVPADFVEAQLRSVFTDVRIDAVKIGMLGTADVVRVVANILKEFQPRFVVLDPVMVATSGDSLMHKDAVDALKEELIPLASLITPNVAEAEVLLGRSLSFADDQIAADLCELRDLGADVLVKGGHMARDEGDIYDIFMDDAANGNAYKFYHEYIEAPELHGTGCTLSSAIACFAAHGQTKMNAIESAQNYICEAIRAHDQVEVGSGAKPLKHFDLYPSAEANAWVDDLALYVDNDNSLGEFQAIEKYFAPLSLDGLKNDGAVIDVPEGMELVVTTDTLNEGVHYLAADYGGRSGQRALLTNLSDLASMGAEPLAYQLSLSLPKGGKKEDWFEAFASDLQHVQEQYGIQLSGGDTTCSLDEHVSISITAMGLVPTGRALKRDGAKSGDLLCVSGTIGDAVLGLELSCDPDKELEREARGYLVRRYHSPDPRVSLGIALRDYAHACADVSDGLVADIEHMAKASGVRAVIDLDAVPLSAAARSAELDPLRAMSGGDDYELAFALTPADFDTVQERSHALGVSITVIGYFEEGDGVEVRDAQGEAITISHKGWQHF